MAKQKQFWYDDIKSVPRKMGGRRPPPKWLQMLPDGALVTAESIALFYKNQVTSRDALNRLYRRGVLIRVGHGVYQKPKKVKRRG